MGTDTVSTTPTKEATVPSKRTAKVPPAPSPEPLIRLAFKESDLKLLIDTLEEAGLTPEVSPIFHRLKMRYSEHALKSL